MGEFAKGKIEGIIEFFDNNNAIYDNKREELFKIINLIGEPFIKDKLLYEFYEKFPKTNVEKIMELEEELLRLKNDKA